LRRPIDPSLAQESTSGRRKGVILWDLVKDVEFMIEKAAT
jgi:hypothetical protein